MGLIESAAPVSYPCKCLAVGAGVENDESHHNFIQVKLMDETVVGLTGKIP